MKLTTFLSITGLFFSASVFAQQKPAKPIPHLEKRGQVTQLIVDGKPYLILGGELHNSNTSNLEYLRPIMAKVAAMHFNTVLGAVNWDLLEPQEGKFDFTLVDGLIKQSRENKMKLAKNIFFNCMADHWLKLAVMFFGVPPMINVVTGF